MRTLLLTTAALISLAACGAPETADRAPARPPHAEAAASPPPAPVPAKGSDTLTAHGYGALRVGMTREEIDTALGAESTGWAGAASTDCAVFHPAGAPQGLTVLMENGRLSRIQVGDGADVKTGEGLGLGSTAEQVRTMHPDVVVEPHKSIAGAQTLTVWTGGRPAVPYVLDPTARGVRYVIDAGGRVVSIRAGGPAIQQGEGCG